MLREPHMHEMSKYRPEYSRKPLDTVVTCYGHRDASSLHCVDRSYSHTEESVRERCCFLPCDREVIGRFVQRFIARASRGYISVILQYSLSCRNDLNLMRELRATRRDLGYIKERPTRGYKLTQLVYCNGFIQLCRMYIIAESFQGLYVHYTRDVTLAAIYRRR